MVSGPEALRSRSCACGERGHRSAAISYEHTLVPISFGELIDKITILEIKSARIAEAEKLANIRNELNLLTTARARFPVSAEIEYLQAQLKQINEALWDIEDRIRHYERDKDFGSCFIELARTVYKTNDRRAAVKRQLNQLAGSSIIEEKSYHDYAS
jgi:hypothetical protein